MYRIINVVGISQNKVAANDLGRKLFCTFVAPLVVPSYGGSEYEYC